METITSKRLHRRAFEEMALAPAWPASLALLAGNGHTAGIAVAQSNDSGQTPTLAPTPQCGDEADLEATVQQTAEPFYTPSSPERRSLLEAGMN